MFHGLEMFRVITGSALDFSQEQHQATHLRPFHFAVAITKRPAPLPFFENQPFLGHFHTHKSNRTRKIGNLQSATAPLTPR